VTNGGESGYAALVELPEAEMLVSELETRMDRLRALYEQYFLGFEKTEPLVVRKDVDRRFEVLRRAQFRNTALRFRFQMIQQRYSTMSSYWMRICRQIEEGTFKRHIMRAKARFGDAAAPVKVVEEPGFDIDVDIDDFDAQAALEDTQLAFAAPPPPPVSRSAMDILREEARMLAAQLAAEDAQAAPVRAPMAPPTAIKRPEPVQAPRANTAKPSTFSFDDDVFALPVTSGFDKPLPPPSAPAIVSAKPVQSAPLPARSAPTSVQSAPSSPRAAVAAREPGPRPPPTVPRAAPAPTTAVVTAPLAKAAAPPVAARMPPAATAAATKAPPAATAAATKAPPSPPAAPPQEDKRMRELYAEYITAKRSRNESTANVTFDSVAKSLQASTAKLREKHVGKRIDFEVAEKDGKVILKPIVKSAK
jgi:hypothetical protein